MSRRSLQLLVAGSFLLGVGVMVLGLILCVFASFAVGISVLPLGALIAGAARIVSRRFELDAA